jgi:hypothetical protein
MFGVGEDCFVWKVVIVCCCLRCLGLDECDDADEEREMGLSGGRRDVI